MINWWGVFWPAEKGGVLGAGTARKRGGGGGVVLGADPTRNRGVLGAGQVKGGLYRGTHLYWTYMSVPPPHGM